MITAIILVIAFGCFGWLLWALFMRLEDLEGKLARGVYDHASRRIGPLEARLVGIENEQNSMFETFNNDLGEVEDSVRALEARVTRHSIEVGDLCGGVFQRLDGVEARLKDLEPVWEVQHENTEHIAALKRLFCVQHADQLDALKKKAIKKPPPPGELVGALQDRIHRDSGPQRAVKSIKKKVKP